ncbi:dienelactone hydrolase family protein [Methylovirgula sp. 4M-Z18]|uniref:dienelactone hydrolase family protein n=1 Tax=Methylovirgula sp. 4M-Z18 TaxID=2293567 RepID=UPI001313F5B0|nr:dienelactone hydrolase family protein [Methylovirgula sp. 4M-Z18]
MSQDIVTEELEIDVPGSAQAMAAFLARPAAAGPHPAVIICGELYGLNGHIRDIAQRFARAGYVALAPDFYHRSEKLAHLPYTEAGRQKGFTLLRQLRRADAIADVRAALDHLRRRHDTGPKIGIAGFSFGGHIAYLAATQLDLAAIAILYGGWITNTDIPLSQPEATVSLTSGIAARNGKLLYMVGALDHAITKEQTDAIEHALQAAGVRHDMVIYPNVKHGFFCDDRDTFDETARDDAWRRMLALFQEELRES